MFSGNLPLSIVRLFCFLIRDGDHEGGGGHPHTGGAAAHGGRGGPGEYFIAKF